MLQSCAVTSPISNTIRVLCEFLGASRRISVNATCASCEGAAIVIGNSPLDIPNLLSESYSVEVIAVDGSNKRLGDNSIAQTITVNTGILVICTLPHASGRPSHIYYVENTGLVYT